MGCLEGKVAIVTGSAQGIGRGIAIGLSREGANVIVNDLCEKGEVSTVDFIKKECGDAFSFYCDVCDEEAVKKMVDFAIEKFGRLDIVVNNAAGLGSGSINSLTTKDWDKLTIAKTKGAFLLMHYAVPIMMKQKFGRILNCSSEAWTGLIDNDAYSAANAGVVGLTWASAKELYRYGITVNAYCPEGASPSHEIEYNKMLKNVKAMTGKDVDPRLLKEVESDHADPVNLGPIVSFLCSEDASYITGEVFAIKSSGKISRFSYPTEITHAKRPEGESPLWKVDELKNVFKDTIMGKDYVSHVTKSLWQKNG